MNKTIERFCRILPDRFYIQLLFFRHFGKFANLRNPLTFNEKLQWLKLHDRNEQYVTFVDKYLVKDYVAQIIGNEYIIPTIGVWSSPQDIDFEILPDQFVLKWNNDSGSVIICDNKESFDFELAKKQLAERENRNGYWYGREWPYKHVKPYIIAEPYMVSRGDDARYGLTDYKFYCFNGSPHYLYVSRGLGLAHKDAQVSFYTIDWKSAPFRRNDFKPLSIQPKKPITFDLMVEFSKKLSNGVDFLRVDFYEINEKLYFSELTLYPCSGFMKFVPEEYDLKLGRLLSISGDKYHESK